MQQDLKDMNAPVEVVFVSSDRSENDMLQYMVESHGDWLVFFFFIFEFCNLLQLHSFSELIH